MDTGTPEGAASPKRARRRISARRLLMVLAAGLLVAGLEFVILRTFLSLGEVPETVAGSAESGALRVLESGVGRLEITTLTLEVGQKVDLEVLARQISQVNAELRVATDAAVGSPARTAEIDVIRQAFLDYQDAISPVLSQGPNAYRPAVDTSMTSLVKTAERVSAAAQARFSVDLADSLAAARVARAIMAVLSAIVSVVALVFAVWIWRASRRLRTEVGVRRRAEQQRDAAEERYRTLVEHIPAVTYVDRVEPASGALQEAYISPQVENLVGYPIEVWRDDPEFWKKILDPRDRSSVLAEDERTERTGDAFLREYRLIAKDGRIVWVRDEATLREPDADGVRRWQGVMLDVTSQKAADENLRLLESAVLNATEAVLITSSGFDGEVFSALFVNPAFEQLTGYRAEEFVGTDPNVLSGPDTDFEQHVEAAENLRNGLPFSGENIAYRKDGSSFHIEWRTAPIHDESGKITHLVSLMQDVSERVGSERRLREAENRFRMLVEQIPAATYLDAMKNPDDPLELTPEYISPRIEALSGYSIEQWLDGDFWVRILHPDDRDRVMETSQRALDDGTPYSEEYRLIGPDGRVIWVSEDSTVLRDEEGRPHHWLGIYVDQTERKAAQQKLAETEAKYRALVEQIPAILYVDVFGTEMVTAYVSPQIEEILGITVQEYLNDPALWLRHIHPDEREAMRASVQQLVETGASERLPVQYRMVRPDGRVVWIDDRSSILYDAEGKPAFLQGVMLDITAVKSAELELTRSRALLAGAEQMAALGSWEHDPTTGVTTWSDELFRIYGLDPSAVSPSFELYVSVIHPEEREWVSRTVWDGLESGAGYNIEHRILRPDGSQRVVHQVGRVMKDEVTGTLRWSGSIQDVTEQRNAEHERVRNLELLRVADEQRQKLLSHLVEAQEEERERIAGDIHDDPIQKMTAVGMRIETARRRMTDPGQIRILGDLSDVVQASIASLRDLLFDLRPRVLDQDGLGAAIRVYLGQIEEDELRSRLDDRLTEELPPETRTIAYRIAQEAILNARKHASASCIDVVLNSINSGVRVKITDDGVGFEPAKAGSNGSDGQVHFGLGSMRHRAEVAGGWWRAESAPGEGTVVQFWLPFGSAPEGDPPGSGSRNGIAGIAPSRANR